VAGGSRERRWEEEFLTDLVAQEKNGRERGQKPIFFPFEKKKKKKKGDLKLQRKPSTKESGTVVCLLEKLFSTEKRKSYAELGY